MNLFGIDGKIYKFLDKFWNMVWIGILWIICSIPIITIGAASTAAYYAMVRSVRKNEDNSTRDFFKSFKQNFKQATLIWLMMVVVLGLGIFDVLFAIGLEGEGTTITVRIPLKYSEQETAES